MRQRVALVAALARRYVVALIDREREVAGPPLRQPDRLDHLLGRHHDHVGRALDLDGVVRLNRGRPDSAAADLLSSTFSEMCD